MQGSAHVPCMPSTPHAPCARTLRHPPAPCVQLEEAGRQLQDLRAALAQGEAYQQDIEGAPAGRLSLHTAARAARRGQSRQRCDADLPSCAFIRAGSSNCVGVLPCLKGPCLVRRAAERGGAGRAQPAGHHRGPHRQLAEAAGAAARPAGMPTLLPAHACAHHTCSLA